MADTDLLFKIIAQDEYKAKLQEAAALVDKMTDAEKQQVVATHQQAEAERDLANAAQESSGAIGNVREALNTSLVGIQAGIGLAKEAVGAFKQAWDFAKEGAAIERIGVQFRNVATQAGVDADSLVKALDKAAHGTVDDEELMQTATRALALGITSNTDDLVKLMEVARASSVAFGGDTSSAFERISTAIENLTPRALKQSGIVVDLNKAYKDYAAQLGVSATSLSDQEKRQALLNQVLEKAPNLINEVGTASEDTATKIAQAETKLKDFGDTVKVFAAGILGGLFENQKEWTTIWDENAAAADRVKAIDYTLANDVWPWEVHQLTLLRDAITSVSQARQEMGIAFIETATTNASNALADAIKRVADSNKVAASSSSDLVNYITAEEAAMKRTSAAAKEAADLQLGILKVGLTGQVKNEMTAFEDKQASLGDQAQKLAKQIEELQHSAGKTTIQNKMSADELALAQARLAEMELKASEAADTHTVAQHKGKQTAEEIAAAQEKAAQAAANSAAQHNVLAAQIEVAREKINSANTSVTTYVDNSKRIAELKSEYDKVNAEIAKNADAHDQATKRIIFGYLEQQLAAKGLTEAALPVLDKLSVQWGLKSKEDVKAIENVMIAVNQFAKTGNLEVLAKSTGLALTDVGKSAEDASKLTAGLSDLTKGQASTTQESHATMKTSIEETKSALGDWGRTLDALTVNHLPPLTNAVEGLNTSLYGLRYALSELPATIPFFNLPNPATLAPPTPGGPSTPGGTRTPVLQGGAQYGADFIVPPNPRGGSGDYYPVLAAPGEHVSVTPQNGGAGGLPPINITQTFNGAQASPDEYKAAMYQVMIDVINEATR